MNKPGKTARPLAEVMHKLMREAFAKQGFAATELVTRWGDIVGAEIAAHSQPEKIQWPRPIGDAAPEPGTLVLRVEGPTAVEIQHLNGVILDRVNRFFGWQAVGQLALRQAPLRRRLARALPAHDREAAARVAATLGDIADDDLRAALGRLGAAVRGH
jgi:hypothetical protein